MTAETKINICHLTAGPLANASRIYKELETAEQIFPAESLFTLGLNRDGDTHGLLQERFPFEEIALKTHNLPKSLPFQLAKYLEWTFKATFRAGKSGAGILQCHSLPALPATVLARLFSRNTRIVYDAHEFETKRANMSRGRQFASSILERVLMPFVDEILVVSPSIQAGYREQYPSKEITLLLNLPRATTTDSAIDLRAKFSIPDESKIVLYVGVLGPMRGIEPLLKAVENLDGWHCIFLGDGPLGDDIAEAMKSNPNVRHHPFVPENDVVGIVAQADLSFSVIDCTAPSYRYALPNKFFQSLMAGVPIMVNTQNVDMLSFKDRTGMVFGVEYDVAAIREFISSFADRNAPRIPQAFSWEAQQNMLLDIYRRLTS